MNAFEDGSLKVCSPTEWANPGYNAVVSFQYPAYITESHACFTHIGYSYHKTPTKSPSDFTEENS